MKIQFIKNKCKKIIKNIKQSYIHWENRKNNKKKFKEFMKQIKNARN